MGNLVSRERREPGRAAPTPPPPQAQPKDIPPGWKEQVHAAAATLQGFPLESYVPPAGLRILPVAELKAMLARRGLGSAGMLERGELLAALEAHGGGSASACSLCLEDYAPGDILRILPCSHAFHVECVDQALFATSRTPAAPPRRGQQPQQQPQQASGSRGTGGAAAGAGGGGRAAGPAAPRDLLCPLCRADLQQLAAAQRVGGGLASKA